MDVIWPIFSSGSGQPKPGSGIGHIVRMTSSGAIHVIDQFKAGGRFPNADCGPSCVLSSLLDRGGAATISAVETACQTTSKGTTLDNLVRGLQRYGLAVTVVHGVPPSPAPIMNPAPGFVAPSSSFEAYVAASQGVYVRIDTPGPWDNPPVPPPSPPVTEDSDMVTLVIKPGDDPLLIPGLTGMSTANLVALKDCQVALFMWDPSGKPIASKTVTLEGNLEKPGTGPVQAAGYLRNLLGTTFTAPCTLMISASTEPFTISLH